MTENASTGLCRVLLTRIASAFVCFINKCISINSFRLSRNICILYDHNVLYGIQGPESVIRVLLAELHHVHNKCPVVAADYLEYFMER